MKIKTEYVAMGMYVADDQDTDPELNIRGHGRTPEEAINNLVEALLEEAVRPLSDAIRDRDEWRQQHENLLAVRAADVKRLGEQLEARGRYIAILDEKAKSADRMAGFRAMIDENKRLRAEMDRLKAYDPYAENLAAEAINAYCRQGNLATVRAAVEEARAMLAKRESPEICNRSETEGLIREIGYLLPLAKEAAANEPAGASNGLVFKKLGEIEQRYRAVLAQGAGA